MNFKSCLVLAMTATVVPATLVAQPARADHPLTAAVDTLHHLGGQRVAVLGKDAQIAAEISRSASRQRVQVADRESAMTCLPDRAPRSRCSLVDVDAFISVARITREGGSATVEAELIKPNRTGRLHGVLYSIRVERRDNAWVVTEVAEVGATSVP